MLTLSSTVLDNLAVVILERMCNLEWWIWNNLYKNTFELVFYDIFCNFLIIMKTIKHKNNSGYVRFRWHIDVQYISYNVCV